MEARALCVSLFPEPSVFRFIIFIVQLEPASPSDLLDEGSVGFAIFRELLLTIGVDWLYALLESRIYPLYSLQPVVRDYAFVIS